MDNKPIGIFDSGVGGLSVFNRLIKLLPNENYIYFGDTLNLPYGDKTKEQLIEISRGIFDFFASQKVKAVVMACNTTSAITYEIFKDVYNYKIYPVVQTMAREIAFSNYKRIGVFATNATINAHAYRKNINAFNTNIEVYEMACPEWVQIVENNIINEEKSINDIKKYIVEMLKSNPDKIILGCTHYPYLIEALSRYADKNLFLNPADCVAEFVAEDLKANSLLSDNTCGSTKFYVSSNPEQFINSSKLFFDVKEAEKISIKESLTLT
ncbi:glutamate racemase [bacterium]|nr:glutamate racemase [bacterium]